MQTTQSVQETENPSFLKKLGPGLITGAADDDPSGIATYSQAGAQFGFSMLWVMLFTYPLMISIQIISARLGRVTGQGLACTMRKHYPLWLVQGMVALLVIANIINIGADIAAMGDALKLLIGGKAHIYAIGFGLFSVVMQVLVPYQKYVRVLKWLTLVLLIYVASIFTLHIEWRIVLSNTFLPRLSWKPEYLTTIVAVLGTTISPYMFFWQASQEIEEMKTPPVSKPLKVDSENAGIDLSRINIDTFIGMGVSNVVGYFIILTTAVALHQHGVTNIETSADAASALRPVAGDLGFWLFSLGIIGTGLLAVPVLAGSSAYAMADTFKWPHGLGMILQKAKGFYSIIIISTLAGIGLCFSPISPIKALYWSAVINGVLSVPIMGMMMLMASRKEIMGRFTLRPLLKGMGWFGTIAMATAVLIMFWSMMK